ncbi:MAG: cupredoxin family copper-binding protein [Pseudomonadota bacterium]
MTAATNLVGTLTRRRLMAALALLPLAGRARAAAPRDHEVEIKSLTFQPRSLAVTPGDRITWTNRDIAPHTATAADGSWDSGLLERGQSWTLQVTEDTASDYFCAYHPHMTARLSMG